MAAKVGVSEHTQEVAIFKFMTSGCVHNIP